MKNYDVIIIGAGVCGCSIASQLSKYNLSLLIMDKESDVACGTSKANTAIIHAGYDAPYQSLKGELNAKGNEMYEVFSKRLGIPFKRIGSLVLAYNQEDMKSLERLKENGDRLNIPDLKILSKEEVLKKEPNINEEIMGGLWAPSAGITEPWEVAVACCEHAMMNGAELALNSKVKSIEKSEDLWIINDQYKTQCVINAAGVFGDQILKMIHPTSDFTITPRRGQYYLFDKTSGEHVHSVIFQAPTKLGKGVVVAPTLHGNLIVGPDSEDLTSDDKEAIYTTKERLEYIKKMSLKTCKGLDFRENITNFSGLRAEPSINDFLIEIDESYDSFIHVIGIKSPGLSSVPAIAEYVEKLVQKVFKNNNKNIVDDVNYIPNRKPRLIFHELSNEQKKEIIKNDDLYGRIICRCEEITEGEIVDAIKRPCGARTINGVKRRVRPGSGRCQGGFCEPRVLEILARELNKSPLEIKKENEESYILKGYLGEA